MQHSGEYYSKGSIAEEYDFAMFENNERLAKKDAARKETQRQERMKKNREEQAQQGRRHNQVLTIIDKHGKLRVAMVLLMAVVFTILVGIMIANGQKVNDINHDIDDLNTELALLEQDYEVMKITFESKMSDAAIEQYATEVLGMQHRDNNQIEWLKLNDSDVFEDCSTGTTSIFRWGNN